MERPPFTHAAGGFMSEDWLDPEKRAALIKRARRAIAISRAAKSAPPLETAQRKIADKEEGERGTEEDRG